MVWKPTGHGAHDQFRLARRDSPHRVRLERENGLRRFADAQTGQVIMLSGMGWPQAGQIMCPPRGGMAAPARLAARYTIGEMEGEGTEQQRK
jgi:hypothetical protein